MFIKPLKEQLDFFIKTILKNPNIKEILDNNPFPNTNEWYLGAGCLNQTVWNYLLGNEIEKGIGDYDLIYYDASNLNKRAEIREQKRLRDKFSHLAVELDVVNEARAHLWFEEDFGKKIDQYKSVEDAIRHWPTTATCVGVNKVNDKVNVFAPYGLGDLLGMIIKPNKPSVIREVYEEKIKKWKCQWPGLTVISWKEG
ncbi:MAG: nucleotidyltransferase family protein [Candidatus Marinimicrobia bacterium]|nr:nucleotidyltransferase family protein [Candidatus Neomarinimicrobiota bacterium]